MKQMLLRVRAIIGIFLFFILAWLPVFGGVKDSFSYIKSNIKYQYLSWQKNLKILFKVFKTCEKQ